MKATLTDFAAKHSNCMWTFKGLFKQGEGPGEILRNYIDSFNGNVLLVAQ